MYRKGMSTVATLLIILGFIGIVALGMFGWYSGKYNTLSRMDEACNVKYAEVENAYQRRFDLIPRILNITKMYLSHEKELLTDIATVRSQWGEALATGDQSLAEEASTGFERVVGRLLMITTSENYPELKADKQVTALFDELTGTENRLSTARMRYNDQVGVYNTYRRDMLTNMFFGNQFPERDYFEVNGNVWEAPNVNIG